MILQEVEDVNTSVVVALVAEDYVLLLEAAANADVEVLVPPAALVDAVSATAESSGVLAVLDVYGDELLDSAMSEVLVGTGIDVAMIPVVLDDDDASTPVLNAVANDGVLLPEAVDAEVDVLSSPAMLEDVVFASGKKSKTTPTPGFSNSTTNTP